MTLGTLYEQIEHIYQCRADRNGLIDQQRVDDLERALFQEVLESIATGQFADSDEEKTAAGLVLGWNFHKPPPPMIGSSPA